MVLMTCSWALHSSTALSSPRLTRPSQGHPQGAGIPQLQQPPCHMQTSHASLPVRSQLPSLPNANQPMHG